EGRRDAGRAAPARASRASHLARPRARGDRAARHRRAAHGRGRAGARIVRRDRPVAGLDRAAQDQTLRRSPGGNATMTCTRYETELALYVERDLSDADAAAVEAHLHECPTCPSFLAELRASQALVKDLAAEEVSPDSLAAVRVEVVPAATVPHPRHDRQVPAWAAAAGIVLALGTLAWVVAFVGGAD